jgi:hypothetical protein
MQLYYGNLKKLWKVKGQDSYIINVTKPCKRVSVYQLEPSTPGLIAQLKGIPTTTQCSHICNYNSLTPQKKPYKQRKVLS